MLLQQIIPYLLVGSIGLLVLVVIIFLILKQKMGKSEYKKIKALQEGTKTSNFSLEILYEKLY